MAEQKERQWNISVDSRKTGAYLAGLRKRFGFTQTEAAEKLHISNKAISKWESGKGLPEVTMLPVLAALYKVTVDEILAGEDRSDAKGSDHADQAQDPDSEIERTEALVSWRLNRSGKGFFFFCLAIWVLSGVGPVILWILDGKLGLEWVSGLVMAVWIAVTLLTTGICLGLQFFDRREIVKLGGDSDSCRLVFWNRGMNLILPLMLAGCAVLVFMHTEEFLMPEPLPAPFIDNLPDTFSSLYAQAWLGLSQLDLNVSFNGACFLYVCLPFWLLASLLWGTIKLAGEAWIGRKRGGSFLLRQSLGIGTLVLSALLFAGISSAVGSRYENERAVAGEVFADEQSFDEFADEYLQVYEGYRAYALRDGQEWPELSEKSAAIDCRYLDNALGEQERYAAYRNVIGLDKEKLTVWRVISSQERVENRLLRITFTGVAAGGCLAVLLIGGLIWKKRRLR